jgi:hypothetical protein
VNQVGYKGPGTTLRVPINHPPWSAEGVELGLGSDAGDPGAVVRRCDDPGAPGALPGRVHLPGIPRAAGES